MFKKTVSALLVVSMLSWTLGCTSFKPLKESENLAQYEGKKIQVHTNTGIRYQLATWKQDSTGTITGTGKLRYESWYWTPSGRHIRRQQVEPFSGSIPADSIATVKIRKVDATTTTILLVFGVAPVLVLIIGGFSTGYLSLP